MTTLLTVTIDKLAGRKDPINYSLRPDVNIFFGLNGSGKTSLLKILDSALRNDNTDLLRVPFSSARIRFFSEANNTEMERSIAVGVSSSEDDATERAYRAALEHVIEEQGGNVTYQVADELARRQLKLSEWETVPDDKGRFRHRYLSTNRLMGAASSALRGRYGPIAEAEVDTAFANQIEQIWRVYTNDVLSKVTEIQSNGLREILRSLLFATPESTEQPSPQVREAYERASHFLDIRPANRNSSQFGEFQRRFSEEPHFKGVVQDIDEIERQIEQAEEPRRRLAQLIGSFFTEGKSLAFTNQGISARVNDEVIPLASLSSGEKQLIRILIEVIMAEDDLILIDEPELSMHIDWQRNLVNAMRAVNPHVQIIMATHSPDIMADVPDECIFRL